MRFVNIVRENANSHPRCFQIFLGVSGSFLLILAIIKVIVGALYAWRCAEQPFAPVYLIVGGLLPLVFAVTVRFRNDASGTRKCQTSRFQVWLFAALSLLLLVWLITGTVYIIRLHNRSQLLPPCDGQDSAALAIATADVIPLRNVTFVPGAPPRPDCVDCDVTFSRLAIGLVATDMCLACVAAVLFLACFCFSLIGMCLLSRDDDF